MNMMEGSVTEHDEKTLIKNDTLKGPLVDKAQKAIVAELRGKLERALEIAKANRATDVQWNKLLLIPTNMSVA